MKRVISKLTIALLFSAWLMSYSFAEDRALFIGLSEYRNADNNLLGPNVDIQLMIDIAERLGFERSQMRMLLNENATQQNILREMRTWLVNGVQPGDRVFIYYTGHGARVADFRDSDGCDEALVPYGGFASAITGNDIDAALADSQAAEMLFIVDSCFSGNLIDSTRGIKSAHVSLGGRQAKNYDSLDLAADEHTLKCNTATNITIRPIIPVKSAYRNIGTSAKEDAGFAEDIMERALFMSAASNDEVALGSRHEDKGSLFTQSLFDELAGTDDITFDVLIDAVAAVMHEEIANDPSVRGIVAPKPTISGPSEWRVKNFYDFGSLSKTVNPRPNINIDKLLSDLESNTSFAVRVTTNRRTLRLREFLEFDIYSEKSGYLYIYDHGANGELTLIFPNEFAPNNYQIRANESVRIPGRLMPFDFPAVEPVGVSRVVVIVSERDLNLYHNPICGISGGFDRCYTRNIAEIEERFKVIRPELRINSNMGEQEASERYPLPLNNSFGMASLYVTVTF